MELKSILGKLKSLLSILFYAGLAYSAYLTYQRYQIGGVEMVMEFFSSLPVEVLLLVVVGGALVLTAALGQ